MAVVAPSFLLRRKWGEQHGHSTAFTCFKAGDDEGESDMHRPLKMLGRLWSGEIRASPTLMADQIAGRDTPVSNVLESFSPKKPFQVGEIVLTVCIGFRFRCTWTYTVTPHCID